jgi:hypothetical protein
MVSSAAAPLSVPVRVLALQAGLIDAQQLVEARQLASARPDTSLADLLVERRWVLPADRGPARLPGGAQAPEARRRRPRVAGGGRPRGGPVRGRPEPGARAPLRPEPGAGQDGSASNGGLFSSYAALFLNNTGFLRPRRFRCRLPLNRVGEVGTETDARCPFAGSPRPTPSRGPPGPRQSHVPCDVPVWSAGLEKIAGRVKGWGRVS